MESSTQSDQDLLNEAQSLAGGPSSNVMAPPPAGMSDSPYDDLITQASQAHNIPTSVIKAVMGVESGGNHMAVSPKGARGLMQIMPGTWDSLGGGDPHDPATNIDRGAKYLRQLADRFGEDWPKVLAAYNQGPTAVAAGRAQPKETREYVKKVTGKLPAVGLKKLSDKELLDQALNANRVKTLLDPEVQGTLGGNIMKASDALGGFLHGPAEALEHGARILSGERMGWGDMVESAHRLVSGMPPTSASLRTLGASAEQVARFEQVMDPQAARDREYAKSSAMGAALDEAKKMAYETAGDPMMWMLPASRLISLAFVPGMAKGAIDEFTKYGVEVNKNGMTPEAARKLVRAMGNLSFGALAGAHALTPGEPAPSPTPTEEHGDFAPEGNQPPAGKLPAPNRPMDEARVAAERAAQDKDVEGLRQKILKAQAKEDFQRNAQQEREQAVQQQALDQAISKEKVKARIDAWKEAKKGEADRQASDARLLKEAIALSKKIEGAQFDEGVAGEKAVGDKQTELVKAQEAEDYANATAKEENIPLKGLEQAPERQALPPSSQLSIAPSEKLLGAVHEAEQAPAPVEKLSPQAIAPHIESPPPSAKSLFDEAERLLESPAQKALRESNEAREKAGFPPQKSVNTMRPFESPTTKYQQQVNDYSVEARSKGLTDVNDIKEMVDQKRGRVGSRSMSMAQDILAHMEKMKGGDSVSGEAFPGAKAATDWVRGALDELVRGARTNKLGFYSRLEEVADRMPQPMKGDAMGKWLAGQGVKKAELEERRIFLDPAKTYTPEDLRARVEKSRTLVDLREKVYGEGKGATFYGPDQKGHRYTGQGEIKDSYRERLVQTEPRKEPWETEEDLARSAYPGPEISHFENQRGVIGHVRSTEHVNVEGGSDLHLEELQSDTSNALAADRKNVPVEILEPGDPDNPSEHYWALNNKEGETVMTATSSEMATKKFEDARADLDTHPSLDVPHIKDMGWLDVLMKNSLWHAAQGGHDRLTWTTGEEQGTRNAGRTHADVYDRMMPKIAGKWVKEMGGEGKAYLEGPPKAESPEIQKLLDEFDQLKGDLKRTDKASTYADMQLQQGGYSDQRAKLVDQLYEDKDSIRQRMDQIAGKMEELTPGGMKRDLAEHGRWAVDLAPEVRDRIKRQGFPLFGEMFPGAKKVADGLTKMLEDDLERVKEGKLSPAVYQKNEEGFIRLGMLTEPLIAVKKLAYGSRGWAQVIGAGRVSTAINNFWNSGVRYTGAALADAIASPVSSEARSALKGKIITMPDIFGHAYDSIFAAFGEPGRSGKVWDQTQMAEELSKRWLPKRLHDQMWHLLSTEVRLPQGGTRRLEPHERLQRGILLPNALQERPARLAIMRAEMQPLFDELGVHDFKRMKAAVDANPKLLPKARMAMNNAVDMALNMTMARPAVPGPLKKFSEGIKAMPLSWAWLPDVGLYTQAMLHNMPQQVLEQMPLLGLATKRIRWALIDHPNAVAELPALEKARDAAKAAWDAAHTDPNRATLIATNKAFGVAKSKIHTMESVGLPSKRQIAELSALGPITMALFAAKALHEKKDDSNSWAQIAAGPKGMKKDTSGLWGSLGIYALAGHYLGKQWLNRPKYKGEAGYANFKEAYETLTQTRKGVGVGDLVSSATEKGTPTDKIWDGIERLGYSWGRFFGGLGWMGEVSRKVEEAGDETGKAGLARSYDRGKAGAMSPLRAFGQGFQGQLPSLRESLPPSYSSTTGNPRKQEGGLFSEYGPIPGKVSPQGMVDRFIEENKGLVNERGFAIAPTKDRVYDEALFRHYREELADSQIPEIISGEMSDTREGKVQEFEKEMAKLRDLAHVGAKKELLDRGVKLPESVLRAAREAAKRKDLKYENPSFYRGRKKPGYQKMLPFEQRQMEEEAGNVE